MTTFTIIVACVNKKTHFKPVGVCKFAGENNTDGLSILTSATILTRRVSLSIEPDKLKHYS